MIRIEIKHDIFLINDVEVSFPIPFEKLKEILGECRSIKSKHNHVFTWDELGIIAYSNKGKLVETLNICMVLKDYKQFPKQGFPGNFLLNDEPALSYYEANKKQRIKHFRGDKGGAFIVNGVSVWFNVENEGVELISVSEAKNVAATEVREPLVLDQGFEIFKPLWSSWISELNKIVPEDNDAYNHIHGIQQEDIELYSLLEGEIRIPTALINFYKVHNVEDVIRCVFSFSVNGWMYDLLPFKDIKQEWSNIQFLQFEEDLEQENLEDYSEKVKADDYANPRWIPFATGRNGDYLLFDTDPSDLGTYGQIIELQNEAWLRDVVADSLTDLVQQEIDALKVTAPERFDYILGK